MKIAITTDHAGMDLLDQLRQLLEARGHECVNFGPQSFVSDDDYPDLIVPAAKAVASGDCELGIIMGGSGQGEAMAANRVPGVRCTVFYGQVKAAKAIDAEGTEAQDGFEILRLSRQHNNANVLSLAARFLRPEDIEQAIDIWLNTPFSGLDRHQRRNDKLDRIA